MFLTLIFAQEVPAPALTLETAVREALSHHRRLAAAHKETDAARLAVRSAHARTNPEIHFAPALDQFNGTTEELFITQPLEINGTRAARTRGAAQAVPATVLSPMNRAAVEVAAADGEPSIDAAIQRLALAGTPRSAWPQHLHWSWQATRLSGWSARGRFRG